MFNKWSLKFISCILVFNIQHLWCFYHSYFKSGWWWFILCSVAAGVIMSEPVFWLAVSSVQSGRWSGGISGPTGGIGRKKTGSKNHVAMFVQEV